MAPSTHPLRQAEVIGPIVPAPLPRADMRVRLKTSPALHRWLPAPLVIRRAERKASSLWQRSPAVRGSARACMEAVISGTARADELEELARTHVIEHEILRTLFWRHWHFESPSEESLRPLLQALEADTGTLVSWTHLGFFFNAGRCVLDLGHDLHRVTGPWFLEAPSNDAWGRRIVHWHNMIASPRGFFVRAKRSYDLLKALLEEGKVVLLAFDVPGRRETRFLGKPVMLADGTARLAAETGANIVPMRARREGDRVTHEYAPALDPRQHRDADALHEALAAVHERWILEVPATLEDPRRPGFWEAGATPLGWTLRSRSRVA